MILIKAKRQSRILNIIAKESIGTQHELAERLKEEGFKITQATVSRDIKELRLTKVSVGENAYRYVSAIEKPMSHKLQLVLKEFLVSYEFSENIIILKTAPGNANTIASALDHSKWPEIIGSLAGDDTILLVVKPKEAIQDVLDRIDSYWHK